MKGKSYALPVGMVFKKYYCSKCGFKLEKERTHRVVSKDDKDYYRYHEYGTFPRNDHDVYDYRFKCSSCNSRISFVEQCIIERIQKKCKSKILSSTEVKKYYKECKSSHNKKVLIRNILIPTVFITLFFPLFYFFSSEKSTGELIFLISLYLLSTIGIIIGAIGKSNGNEKLRHLQSYSYEEESQFNRLHAYSSHNKQLINESNKCFCFYCKSSYDRKEVIDYVDDGQTAICPKCGIGTVLPDNIEEINEKVIDEMNKYWF